MAQTAAEERLVEQPAEQKHPMVALREQMNARASEFQMALPPQMPVERFMRVAMTAIQKNPELVACDRRSLFNALMDAANDGLKPDGRQGVIVPFRDNNPRSPTKGQLIAQWIPMVAGLLTRWRNSGEFKGLTAGVVLQGERFDHWIDESGPHMLHRPGDSTTGKIIKAYAVAQLVSGGTMIKVMSRDDIEKRRKASRQPNSLMWTTFYEEGAIKTVLRNLSKSLPSSSDDIDRLSRDDDLDPTLLTDQRRLPSDQRNEQQVSGVLAALDQFGGRAPAAGEDSTPTPLTQPQEPAQEATNDKTQEAQQLALPEHDGEQSPIEIARARGAQARRDGLQRRAIPGEYRSADREAEANAWREGWESTDE
jgi:recombination protein RecT